MKPERQIVAMGGGGFSMEDSPRLDDFILSLACVARPRVCFIATASGDNDNYIRRFYSAFPPERAAATHLPLFIRDTRDPRKLLASQHVIYVGGGNTANMLAVWRLHHIDQALREAWERGVVLAGISAGANCWFEACSTDSFGPLTPLRDGLGFLEGSMCPHYDGEVQRRPTLHEFIRRGELPAGYAADDGAALHFAGTELREVVCSRDAARAYRVELLDNAVSETSLSARRLDE